MARQKKNPSIKFELVETDEPIKKTSAMLEEGEALKHGIDQIWDDLRAKNNSEFASKEESSVWKVVRGNS